ncbi:D-amino-acid transaminase [Thalassobacillus hwangdonensis]|uniref:D-alanine aminotransferase n=1 Tax=Thalassobacillus hwangdonensis TaxID=546108 RepID=A0ABW3KVK5_9BACI
MAISPYILTEKDFVAQEKLQYPFEERGLQFGDGVYEVIRVYQGDYYLLDEHLDRLYRSAEAIKIQIPFTREEMDRRLHDLLERNDIQTDAKVYLQMTRGSAARDHAFPEGVVPNFYAYVQEFPRNLEALRQGGAVHAYPDIRWDYCYIKSLNLLPNVLAKQEAKEKGCFEALFHKDGEVTECSASNAYLVKDGKVYTHPTKKNILYGCVRLRIEKFCNDLGIPFIETPFRLEDIKEADEMFSSSSVMEIMPILKVDDTVIGEGTPGSITKQLQKAYETDAGIKEANSIFHKVQ